MSNIKMDLHTIINTVTQDKKYDEENLLKSWDDMISKKVVNKH